MKIYPYLSILLLGILFLGACSTPQASPVPETPRPDEPVSSDTPTSEPGGEQPLAGDVIVGENAIVEDLQVMVLESFPVQINVLIKGFLPDGCTMVREISPDRDGDVFKITILTQRPADAVCTEALVPFEETINLDVVDLEAGTYTVRAYDQNATFTLQTDNVLPQEAPCPQPETGQQLLSRDIEATGAAFCFLFPADFNILGSGAPDFFQFIGPRHGDGPEPVSASFTIATIEPAGRTLETYIQEKLDEYPGMTFTPEDISLGNETAILVDQLPGRMSQRTVFAEHNGLIYELAFAPADDAFPEAQADMQRLYQTVLETWVFPQ